MKIYINDFTKPIKAEILPVNTPTLDETLETFSFALVSTKKSLGASKIAPMQKVKVDFTEDGTEVSYFYIVSDSVDVFSTNPVRYKHTITCIQNTRALSKHVVRNSSFSQPARKYKKSETSISEFIERTSAQYPIGDMALSTSYGDYGICPIKKLGFTSREKVKKAYIRLDVQVGVRAINNGIESRMWLENIHSLSDINDQLPKALTQNNIYINDDDTNTHVVLNPSDLGLSAWEYNKDIECPLIKEYIENGKTDLYLSTALDINNHPTILFEGQDFITTGTVPVFIAAQLKIIVETYYYDCYDILDLLIKRQLQYNNNNTDATPLFSLPSDPNNDLYKLLKSTVAPNFTFTQSTMYECVAEVFRLFDAIFNMDEDGVLGIEYFNDLSGEVITPKLTGTNETISEDKYTNGLISYYQDGRSEVTFPSQKSYANARSSQIGVPNKDDHYFIVDHDISSIIQLKARIKNLNVITYLSGSKMMFEIPGYYYVDMTDWVVTEDLWSELDVTNEDGTSHPRVLIQSNTLSFSQGDNKIVLAKLMQNLIGQSYYIFWNALKCALAAQLGIQYNGLENLPTIPYPDENKWNEVYLQATYFAILDGRTQVESLINKYEGETLVDQYNGAIDLNKMGLNMLGLSLKLGEPTLNASHIISKWSKRIKTGQIYKNDDGLWIANVCSYTILNNDYLQGKISFVKNFNQLSLRTQLLREKWMSDISRELVLKSEDNYIDHVYFSSKEINEWADVNNLRKIAIAYDNTSRTYFYQSLSNTFKNTYDLKTIGFATIDKETNDQDYETSGYMSSGTITSIGGGYQSTLTINVPNLSSYREITVTWDKPNTVSVSYTINGDDIVLVATSVDDRDFDYTEYIIFCGEYKQVYVPLVKYGAGNALCFEMSFDSPMSAGTQTTTKTGWFGTSVYNTSAVKYADSQGFKDSFNIYLHLNEDYEFDEYFPDISQNVVDSENAQVKLEDYRYFKQPNEIFALNYEVVFLPGDANNDFIGSAFINNNFLVDNNEKEPRDCYLYYSTDENAKYSVLDTKGQGLSTPITSINAVNGRLDFNFASLQGVTSWALCNGRGDILFASNEGWSGNKSQVSIYIYLSHARLD